MIIIIIIITLPLVGALIVKSTDILLAGAKAKEGVQGVEGIMNMGSVGRV